jgi:putative nucleotidyltransferase with HDIG domain
MQLKFSPLLDRVRAVLPGDSPAYLVGGAVRDAILGRPTHDLDFAVQGNALKLSAQVADRLGAAYYPLAEEPRTGRVILIEEGGERVILDFASFRGPNLEHDLRARDFTINAMAVRVDALDQIIDPLGGGADLHRRVLRTCGPDTFHDDPLRILRGVRLATAFSLHMLPETRAQLRKAIPKLNQVAPERVRDELFRLLEGPSPATAIQLLDLLGVLEVILPELVRLKGLAQSSPHISDVFSHTMRTMTSLEGLLSLLSPIHDPDQSGDLMMGLAAGKIGRYRQEINAHLDLTLTPERPLRPLLFLAALYHDVGKSESRQEMEDGQVRFFGHPETGAQISAQRAADLRLSNAEKIRLGSIVLHHMRPLLLTQTGKAPSRRAIYRFFRDTDAAGVDICLLALADTLATYGPTLPQDLWIAQLDVVRGLLEAWWEKRQEQVEPPALVRGEDLIQVLQMAPGPAMGDLLERLREAQACGEIKNRTEALKLARQWLEERS